MGSEMCIRDRNTRVQFVLFEVIMMEECAIDLHTCSYFSKPVHIKLSDKGQEVIMSEMPGKDLSSQPRDIFNKK